MILPCVPPLAACEMPLYQTSNIRGENPREMGNGSCSIYAPNNNSIKPLISLSLTIQTLF